jgi:hypothetical protein
VRVGSRNEPLGYLELFIIELYNGYRNNHLPAYADVGLAAQNPRLLEAFTRLGAKDAEYKKKHEG